MGELHKPLLTVEGLRVHFFLREGTVRAVDGLSLAVPRGATLGLVGESGCGKSVAALAILRLVPPPGRIVAGRIILQRPEGEVELTALREDSEALRRIRGKEIAMVFQEPMTSLSPVHTIGAQVLEAITTHTAMRGAEARARAVEMLRQVGIPDPLRRYRQYPHELSGGMRQRAMIAVALSCRPSLLIADEPTTALDVTIQAQVLELLRRLQAELGMSVLLITHDLGVVAEMASEVAVMYWGRIVERAPTEALFAAPQHPYTRALLRSLPGRGERRGARLQAIAGSVPEPFEDIPGCPFHPRCEEAKPGICDAGEPPPLREVRPGHLVACFRPRGGCG